MVEFAVQPGHSRCAHEISTGTNGEGKLYIAVKGIVFNISTSNSGWFKPGEPWHGKSLTSQ